MQVTRTELHTGWHFQDIPALGASPTTKLPWLPAEVPGHVHLDLLRAGAIPDPFYRLNERAVAWVDETDWVYETTFHQEAPAPTHAYLVFHGLDTVAEVFLNGESLGHADNMYIPHEFPVGGKLKAGEGEDGDNVLRVHFYSALHVGRERHQAWDEAGNDTRPPEWFSWGPRSFVRKAQYMYGWDWGPELLGCGIWQRVELVTVPVARITDWKYDVEFTDDDKAIVTVTADVERVPEALDTFLALRVEIAEESHNLYSMSNRSPLYVMPTLAAEEKQQITVSIMLDAPQRWQPNGIQKDAAEPKLYALELILHSDGKEPFKDTDRTQIGLREIELIREQDFERNGESFKFRVNGQDLFIKGANWIPDSSFPGHISQEQLRERIMQARDAGFNMLRIWGGGLYESEEFYDICDELGILVWQDFPYACALYADDQAAQDAAWKEATAAVRRLRNHPSLALWCGNNENDWFYTQRTPDQPRYLGQSLYHDVLPTVVAEEDPKTPYWPSSPFGGATDCNDPTIGDCHNWDVWHGRGDWVHYTENDSRFCSEFGFASSCGLKAWDGCLAPEDKHPKSAAVRWHDKTRKGYGTFWNFVTLHFPEAQTLEDWVYYSQLNQAEALKYGVEHYRRRKGHNWGTLFWQLNDCWPTQSWAIIDSTGEPKAAYFSCKKFYAPVLLSLMREGETVTAHLVNDLLRPLSGNITLTVATLDGEMLSEETREASVEANAAQIASFSVSASAGREREVYIYARFADDDGAQTAENSLFLAEPKDLRLSDPGISVTINTAKWSSYEITVTAKRFAPYVWLRRTDHVPLAGLADNFFHLRPGETRTLTVSKEDVRTLEELRGLLAVRTL